MATVIFVLLFSVRVAYYYVASPKIRSVQCVLLVHIIMTSVDCRRTNTSVCLGGTQTFQCGVNGGINTVWKGSAFECMSTNNEIVLLQSHYNSIMSSSNIRTCSDGDIAVLAEIISISDTYYTSQINLTVKSTFTGSMLTIACFRDDRTKEILVESYSVTVENSAGLSSICRESMGNISNDQSGKTGMQVPNYGWLIS